MRVLPRSAPDFITDQTRFGYDFAKRQRIAFPAISSRFLNDGLSIAPTRGHEHVMYRNFVTVFKGFRTVFKKHFSIVHLVCGRFVDLSTYSTMKSISLSLRGGYLSLDHPSVINLFSNLTSSIRLFDAILLWNSNIRIESPILNGVIRHLVLLDKLKVYSVSSGSSLAFSAMSLGVVHVL
jgi:hypothetical protein